ncbi:MAG: lamin tail domain-containing protein [Verrucomicrobia bacterium]|jgi:hypothetical protein|nr:lamin tail domain-containing protein [Verrucomicrobiota bacterium]
MKLSKLTTLFSIILTTALSSQAATVWLEDFSGQEGKGLHGDSTLGIVTNMDGITKWSVSGAGGLGSDGSLNWWMVTNGVFEGQDVGTPIGYWETESIDVSSETAVEVQMDFGKVGDGLTGSGNYLKVLYRLNDGSDQQILGITSANQDTYDGVTWTSSFIDVSSVTSIIVEARIKATLADKGFRFDNVCVATYVAPSNIPPEITVNPANLSRVLTVGQACDITVVASEPDGDMVTLGASSLPLGATFSPNPTSAVTSVTNTFSWTPTTKGTENVTFTTSDDADGAGSPVTVNFSIKDASSVMITEIMQNPDAVSDTQGEWFEIYNQSRMEVDINGWTIADDGGQEHVIDNGDPLEVQAWGFLVLGKTTNTATNGNVSVDYAYGSSFGLVNSDDEIVLINASSQEMARVNYDGGPLFPDPTGASMYLTDPNLDQNTGANWAESTIAWPGSTGDLGSPGAPNEQGDWSPIIPGGVFIIR